MEEIRAKYKSKREKEREEREKQQEEESSRYKTRREREREAKEKEEKEQAAKDSTAAKPSSTTTSPARSGKPALAKKPSIEVISKRMSSSSTKSLDATDDGKPARKDSEGSKKEADDDVFTTGDSSEQRPTSNHSLRRTPSPKLTIELLSTVVDSPSATSATKGVVENGHGDTTDTKTKTSSEPVAKKDEVSSAQNGTQSDKSDSVSSERDISDAKPFRSHSQSMSVSSRSPTPPLVPSSSNSVPEWKKQLMERKKSTSSPVHKMSPKAVEIPSAEASLPQWKKELLAKKKTKPDSKVRLRTCMQCLQRFLHYLWHQISRV